MEECQPYVVPPSSSTQGLSGKGFFLDQSNILFTGALSFLASFAVNSFVQSMFELSLPAQAQTNKWQLVLYNFVYVIIVVAIAIGFMYPLARAKWKRDRAAKQQEDLVPTLVQCVNCGICSKSKVGS